MGLDMHAYSCKRNSDASVDFAVSRDAKEIAYWRKHPNLHGWMEKLYRKKGGKDVVFNGSTVEVTAEDLSELEKCVLTENLPETQGFFFGKSFQDEGAMKQDLDFIYRARLEIAKGNMVFYDSSW